MTMFQNPILTGFNPDPAICRGKDKYYIANSTFEYFPGLSIHESEDLVNWELVARPLNNKTLLDMEGTPKSSGVWAPCLTYHDGLYYIVYSNMKTWAAMPFKDAQNYIITSESITGPWSEPVYINSSGFDASLFHDENGRKYFVNMEWDYRKGGGHESFTGILVQELDPKTFELLGEPQRIFTGTKRGLVEGPHIYQKDGYYYLFCAEGGTSYEHAESVARSKDIFGPYEVHPNELLISGLGTDSKIQKAGHGALVQSFEGDWYFAHLCGRPLPNDEHGRCPLGRETALQNIVWKDAWPYLPSYTLYPEETYSVKDGVKKEKVTHIDYELNSQLFDLDFQSLRVPLDESMMRKEDNELVLVGKQSLYSLSKQSLLVRRQQDFEFEFGFTLMHEPTSFQHMAGLIYRYNEDNQYYLYSSFNEDLNQTVLNVVTIDNANPTFYHEQGIPYEGEVKLKLKGSYSEAQFYFENSKGEDVAIGTTLDVSKLSDEYANPMGFTGAFMGMCAQDLSLHQKEARFKSIYYQCN